MSRQVSRRRTTGRAEISITRGGSALAVAVVVGMLLGLIAIAGIIAVVVSLF